MLARADNRGDRSRAARRPARRGAAVRAHARGEAGRRADPVRRRARWRDRPGHQAQLARPRRLGHGDAARQSMKRSSATSSRAASSARCAPRRPWRRRSSASWRAPRSMRSPSPTRPAGSRSALAAPRAALRRRPVGGDPQCLGRRRRRGAQDRGRRGPAPNRRKRGEIPVIAAFTSAQLDLALGRSNVVHAALLAGPASNGFLARCQSLERFRTIDPGGRGTG